MFFLQKINKIEGYPVSTLNHPTTTIWCQILPDPYPGGEDGRPPPSAVRPEPVHPEVVHDFIYLFSCFITSFSIFYDHL